VTSEDSRQTVKMNGNYETFSIASEHGNRIVVFLCNLQG